MTSVHIVRHKITKKSKGYAFIEFRKERDAENAFRNADGRKIEGHRILVDRELGRTKESWTPRRFGGGKGEKRRDRAEEEFAR